MIPHNEQTLIKRKPYYAKMINMRGLRSLLKDSNLYKIENKLTILKKGNKIIYLRGNNTTK